jgi:hypothetical protein
MAVSFVNGYLCTSCSDVSKAKQGENPHPAKDANHKNDVAAGGSLTDGPAVLYGGSLSGPSTPDGVTALDGSSATDQTTWRNRNLVVDQLA